MTDGFTISQINALGERLRKGKPAAEDLERLEAYRNSFHEVYRAIIRTLRELGLEPGGRIKTTTSIVEKLKRQSFRLSKLQDIAGCRIVVTDIKIQNHIVELISKAFPNTKVIDRRQNSTHGYRATHIVVEVDCAGPQEIQASLMLQSEIFQLLETLEEIISTRLKAIQGKGQTVTGDLISASISGKPLPAEVLESMQWFGDLSDLRRRQEDEKKRITHAIMELRRQAGKR